DVCSSDLYVADTNSNINPDKNRVERVLYYPNMTTDEVLNVIGKPDQQLENLMGTQNYIYEGDSSNDEWGAVILSEHETPEGLKIGPLSVSNSELSSNGDNTSNTSNDSDIDNEEDILVTEAPNPDAEIQDRIIYEGAINEYLIRLAQ